MFRLSNLKNLAHRRTGFEEEAKLCEELDFAATEAYKLLRTNLLFMLPDSEKCHVIGVTSSVRGEGKSTTSINLAYALAAMNKRVLLVDADMRLPTIAKKLKITSTTGLSNVLLDSGLLGSSLHAMSNSAHFHILNAGRIPPNPTELLSSAQMAKLLQFLSGKYDFIILDLPPVNIVSDALVVSSLLDGMLVVVRQDLSKRRDVSRCEHQLSMAGVKILGFVITDVGGPHSPYKYKYRYHYKYKKYYKEPYGQAEKEDGV